MLCHISDTLEAAQGVCLGASQNQEWAVVQYLEPLFSMNLYSVFLVKRVQSLEISQSCDEHCDIRIRKGESSMYGCCFSWHLLLSSHSVTQSVVCTPSVAHKVVPHGTCCNYGDHYYRTQCLKCKIFTSQVPFGHANLKKVNFTGNTVLNAVLISVN